MQHSYLYKAYLLQYLSMGIDEMIDYSILSEEKFNNLAIDKSFLPCYYVEKSTEERDISETI